MVVLLQLQFCRACSFFWSRVVW